MAIMIILLAWVKSRKTINKRKCFPVVFKSEILGSFGAQPSAMLLPCRSKERPVQSAVSQLPAEHSECVMGQ